jgi:hypothetical protein
MGKVSDIFLDTAFYRRALSRWAAAAQGARTADLNTLRHQTKRARQLRSHLDQLIHVADDRLAHPMPGTDDIPAPHNADWVWRPEPWRGRMSPGGLSSIATGSAFGTDIKIFHDCTHNEICLRQLRNRADGARAPYGVQAEVFAFEGAFLSLVFDLPTEAVTNLNRTHILSLNLQVDKESATPLYARLNIRYGPNAEQMVREFPQEQAEATADFDLAYADFNDKGVDAAWIDLIIDKPRMNLVTLRDLTFDRRPRAQI